MEQELLVAVTLIQPPVKVGLTVIVMLLVLLDTTPLSPAGRVQAWVIPGALGTLNVFPVLPGHSTSGPLMEAGAAGISTPIQIERTGPGAGQELLVPYTCIHPPVKLLLTVTFTNERLWFPGEPVIPAGSTQVNVTPGIF